MIICHCNQVSDRQIRRLVRHGLTTGHEIARACGAASRCGACRPAVDEIIADEIGTCATPAVRDSIQPDPLPAR